MCCFHRNIFSHRESFALFPDGIPDVDSGSAVCLWYPSPWPGSGSGNLICERSSSFFSLFYTRETKAQKRKGLIHVTQQITARVGPVPLKETKKPVSEKSPLLGARRRLGFSPNLAGTPISNAYLDTSPVSLPHLVSFQTILMVGVGNTF